MLTLTRSAQRLDRKHMIPHLCSMHTSWPCKMNCITRSMTKVKVAATVAAFYEVEIFKTAEAVKVMDPVLGRTDQLAKCVVMKILEWELHNSLIFINSNLNKEYDLILMPIYLISSIIKHQEKAVTKEEALVITKEKIYHLQLIALDELQRGLNSKSSRSTAPDQRIAVMIIYHEVLIVCWDQWEKLPLMMKASIRICLKSLIHRHKETTNKFKISNKAIKSRKTKNRPIVHH